VAATRREYNTKRVVTIIITTTTVQTTVLITERLCLPRSSSSIEFESESPCAPFDDWFCSVLPMKYLISFAQRHVSFRLPEFDAVIKLEGLEPRDVYDPNGDYNVRWRAG
jgi:hypothetical protein